MAKTQIQVTGLKQLRANIAELDRRMQRKVYNGAMKKAAKIVVAAAQAAAPVLTGTTQKSLVARASSKPSKGLFGVKVTVKFALASNRTAIVKEGKSKGKVYYPDAVERYYRFTELGTKHNAAHPYLKPALETKQGEVLTTIQTELAAGLAEACKGLPQTGP